jgi:hypothetical protein
MLHLVSSTLSVKCATRNIVAHQGGIMKNWRTFIFVLLAAILLPFMIELIIALLPFIGILGIALAGLIITCCVSGGIYVVALAYHKVALMGIRRQREYFSRRYIAIGGIAVFHQEDNPRNLSAERLQLPMSLEEEHQELSEVDQVVIDRSKVLTLHLDEHMGMHAIAEELKLPYNRVRDWCNEAKRLRDQQKRFW